MNETYGIAPLSMEGKESSPDLSLDAEQFLHCHLEANLDILLPVLQLAEILYIQVDQITPIPDLPSWVLGVYNWRGDVLWIVDLGALIGLTPCHHRLNYTATYHIVILTIDTGDKGSLKLNLGAVVSQVRDIEWVNREALHPPATDLASTQAVSNSIAPEMIPFLQGYWLRSEQEVFCCLDVEAVFAAMPRRPQEG